MPLVPGTGELSDQAGCAGSADGVKSLSWVPRHMGRSLSKVTVKIMRDFASVLIGLKDSVGTSVRQGVAFTVNKQNPGANSECQENSNKEGICNGRLSNALSNSLVEPKDILQTNESLPELPANPCVED